MPPDTPFLGTEDGREFFRVLIRGEKQDLVLFLKALQGDPVAAIVAVPNKGLFQPKNAR